MPLAPVARAPLQPQSKLAEAPRRTLRPTVQQRRVRAHSVAAPVLYTQFQLSQLFSGYNQFRLIFLFFFVRRPTSYDV